MMVLGVIVQFDLLDLRKITMVIEPRRCGRNCQPKGNLYAGSARTNGGLLWKVCCVSSNTVRYPLKNVLRVFYVHYANVSLNSVQPHFKH